MWQWYLAILIIDIVVGIIYTIKNPPQPLKSPLTLLYVLFWFLFALLAYQIDQQKRESDGKSKHGGLGGAVPVGCKDKPNPSSKCAGCGRSSCPSRI